MENTNYLSIDPSGSGTTGAFFWNSKTGEEFFANFKSKNWKEHFFFIVEICKEKKVNFVIYETTNFIKIRGSDLTNLFKIFGIIESIPYILEEVNYCETVFVREVKLLQKRIKENNASEMKNLFFRPGRGGGWFRNERKISTHEVDAFLTLYLYFKKNKPEFNFE